MDKSPLGRLPVELRLRIYSNVLPHRKRIRVRNDFEGEDPENEWMIDEQPRGCIILRRHVLNLMALCQEIRREVASELFRRNKVVIMAEGNRSVTAADMLDKLDFVAPRERPLLRKVMVVVRAQSSVYPNGPSQSELRLHATRIITGIRAAESLTAALPLCKVTVQLVFCAVWDYNSTVKYRERYWDMKPSDIERKIREFLDKPDAPEESIPRATSSKVHRSEPNNRECRKFEEKALRYVQKALPSEPLLHQKAGKAPIT